MPLDDKIRIGTTAIFIICLTHYTAGQDRAVLTGLVQMITKLTGRPAIDYNDYGNYCGLGGSGEPVDEVDKCCQAHDNCYGAAKKGKCNPHSDIFTYVIPYGFKIEDKVITCTEGSGIISSALHNVSPASSACGQAICQCDASLAKCLSSAKYDKTHKKPLLHTIHKYTVAILGDGAQDRTNAEKQI